MTGLKVMAQEIGDVDIHEGACPRCLRAAGDSFHALYAFRYDAAAYRELESEVGDVK